MKKLFYILPLLILLSFGVWYFFFSPLTKGGLRGVPNREQAEAAVTKSGLVGYWTMDVGDTNGTRVYDKSGNNFNATLNGGPVQKSGMIKDSIDLDGTDDTVTIADNPLLEADNITITAWIYLDARDDNWMKIVNKRYYANGSCNNDSYELHFDEAVEKVWFVMCISGDSPGVASTYVVPLKQWTHVAATYNGSEMIIYTNASSTGYASGVASGGPDNSNLPVTIGASYENVDNFNGKIDDVRIYNRALSAQEIAEIYNATKFSFVESPTKTASSTVGKLVVHWTMDRGDINGTTIYDKSGRNNHGTAANIASVDFVKGKIKEALDFDGATEYIQKNSPDFAIYGDITTSFWLKGEVSASNACLAIEGGPGETSAENASVYIYRDANTIGYIHEYGTGVNENVTFGDLVALDWRHIVLVRDILANTVKLYVDGEQFGSTFNYTNDPTGGQSSLKLSVASRSGGGEATAGKFDDVRVYNYAMSAQEVKDLYSSAKVNYANTPTKTGLVGYWSMDRNDVSGATIYDKSGSGNNVTTSTVLSFSTGKIKEALVFNGTTDYVSKTSPAGLPIGQSARTISAWIKMTENCATNGLGGNFFHYGNESASGQEFIVSMVNISDNCYLFTDGINANNNITITGNQIPKTNQWAHIIFVFDGASGYTYYLNGVQVANGSFGTTINTAASTVLNIGKRSDLVQAQFPGSIDDVRIYNYALSAQEVANLYNSVRVNYK